MRITSEGCIAALRNARGRTSNIRTPRQTRSASSATRLLVLASHVLLFGCTVHWVADWDKATEDGLLATYRKVDQIYNRLAEAAPAARCYENYAKQWDDVATDLRVLELRQRVRATNEESQKSMKLLAANWTTEKDQFKERSTKESCTKAPGAAEAGVKLTRAKESPDPYPDGKIRLDRKQFQDAFAAALAAESFKK